MQSKLDAILTYIELIKKRGNIEKNVGGQFMVKILG